MTGNLVLKYETFGTDGRPYTVYVWGRGVEREKPQRGYCQVIWYLSRAWPNEPTIDQIQRAASDVIGVDLTLRDMGDNTYWFRRR